MHHAVLTSGLVTDGAPGSLLIILFHGTQADLNQAISMVSYYASSSEPAQVRGKTVYLQYSNRQEIVTSKNSGDVASNVLLVTIEGVEAGHVSIDVMHLVSSTPLSDGSGVQNPNGYHHSCQGSGIIKGDLERWRCNK